MLSDVPSAKRKPPLSTPAGTYATAANMGSGLEPCALCLEVIASIAAGPDGEDEVRSNTIGSLLDLSSQPNILGEAVNFLAKLEGLAEEHILASDKDKCSSGNHKSENGGKEQSLLALTEQTRHTASALRRMMMHYGPAGGKGRKAIKAVANISQGYVESTKPGKAANGAANTKIFVASPFALVCLVATLSIADPESESDTVNQGNTELNRTVARAVASGVLDQNSAAAGASHVTFPDAAASYSTFARRATLSLLKEVSDRRTNHVVDTHIVTALLRTYVSDTRGLTSTCADVVKIKLQGPFKLESGQSLCFPGNTKVDVTGALALAAQIKPWRELSPSALVEVAIDMHLLHAAERICSSAIEFADARSCDDDVIVSEGAVHTLIDSLIDKHMYRQADAMATMFYQNGGRSRYVEARLLHARDTIAKVVAKRQYPIVERQVLRVDRAIERVINDNEIAAETVIVNIDERKDVREFSLLRMRQSGEHESAHRLANLWGMDYTYDEEEAHLLKQSRHDRYLQYTDIFPSTAVPYLISSPDELEESFAELEESDDGAIGFDGEWGEECNGIAVLQLSTVKKAILVDIPELTSTAEGCKCLEGTVGRIFSGERAIVGFRCRQDLSRLRCSMGIAGKEHWLGASSAVIDIKHFIALDKPHLKEAGLSRVCEDYFGKPLDKAEQCSMWERRPLSEQQRAYAALDAWACAALYEDMPHAIKQEPLHS